MTIPASIIAWAGYLLLLVLFGFAAAHVIQGIRFSGGDRHILVATLFFTIFFVTTAAITLLMVQAVNWNVALQVPLPALDGGGL